MKFQKTLLAASLAVVAVAANASQEAKPVSVTENLINANPIYVNGVVSAPVHGYHATLSPVLDTDVDWLSKIGFTADGKQINLGSKAVGVTPGTAGKDIKWDVWKAKSTDGQTLYQFQNPKTGDYVAGYFVEDVTTGKLVAYKGNGTIVEGSLEQGGQIDGKDGATYTTGFENNRVNSEHVIYGYQGATVVENGSAYGTIIDQNGVTKDIEPSNLGTQISNTNDIRYVQTGILANTGAGPAVDPSKNIYGLSARNNNNVTMLTGDGIALADLNNKGVLHTDGSVTNSVLAGQPTTSGVQKTREYNVNGNRVLEVYNDEKNADGTNKLAPSYYQITDSGDVVAYAGAAPTQGTHNKAGVAEYTVGTYNVSKVHNTVTNKNVTYSESISTVDQATLKAGVTDAEGNATVVGKTFDKTEAKIQSEQKVSTGVIGTNDDKSNKYGLEVTKTDANGTQKTEITAGGITTTGTINAKDYQINGVSIVDNIKTSVDGAVAGATEAIDKKVAQVDEKIVEVDKRLTQFNTTAANLNSRVDDLNNRVNDVEETAYRGIAIALAAQQAIPNIGAGQTAVFGGVGHYEGESAGAFGLATVLADGRTSLSGAIGVAGGGEVGGRVGVAYVFGGK